MLKEGYMEGVEDGSICCVPEAIGLGVRRITYKDAGMGAVVDLRVVGLNQGEGTAANFAEVG